MFRRPPAPAAAAAVTLVATLSAVAIAAGCQGKSAPPPSASRDAAAAAPAAGDAATPAPPPTGDAGAAGAAGFTLTPPAGWREVSAQPPLVGSWDGPTFSNGFTPTLNVARQPRPAGEAYQAWRAEFLRSLGVAYKEVKVLDERELRAGELAGRLIIAVVTLPVPKGQPMPLFAYGAIFEVGDSMWIVGAMAAAQLDVRTDAIRPIDEPAILAALTSFRATP